MASQDVVKESDIDTSDVIADRVGVRSPSPTTARLYQHIQEDRPLSQIGPIAHSAALGVAHHSPEASDVILSKMLRSMDDTSPPSSARFRSANPDHGVKGNTASQSLVNNDKVDIPPDVKAAASESPSDASAIMEHTNEQAHKPQAESKMEPLSSPPIPSAPATKTTHDSPAMVVGKADHPTTGIKPSVADANKSTVSAVPKLTTSRPASTPSSIFNSPLWKSSKAPAKSPVAAPSGTPTIPKYNPTPMDTKPQAPIKPLETTPAPTMDKETTVLATKVDEAAASTEQKLVQHDPPTPQPTRPSLGEAHPPIPQPKEPVQVSESPPASQSPPSPVTLVKENVNAAQLHAAPPIPKAEHPIPTTNEAAEAKPNVVVQDEFQQEPEEQRSSLVFTPAFDVELHKRTTTPNHAKLAADVVDDVGQFTSDWWNQCYGIQIEQELNHQSQLDQLVEDDVNNNEDCGQLAIKLKEQISDCQVLLQQVSKYENNPNYDVKEVINYNDMLKQQLQMVSDTKNALEREKLRLDAHYRKYYTDYFARLAAVRTSFRALCARRKDMLAFKNIHNQDVLLQLGLMHFDENMRHASVCSDFAIAQGQNPSEVLPTVVLDVIAELMYLQQRLQPQATPAHHYDAHPSRAPTDT